MKKNKFLCLIFIIILAIAACLMISCGENTYKVSFCDENGEVITEVKVNRGETAVFPSDKNITIPEGKEFSNWSESLENITGNLSVKPVFRNKTCEIKIILENSKMLLLDDLREICDGDRVEIGTQLCLARFDAETGYKDAELFINNKEVNINKKNYNFVVNDDTEVKIISVPKTFNLIVDKGDNCQVFVNDSAGIEINDEHRLYYGMKNIQVHVSHPKGYLTDVFEVQVNGENKPVAQSSDELKIRTAIDGNIHITVKSVKSVCVSGSINLRGDNESVMATINNYGTIAVDNESKTYSAVVPQNKNTTVTFSANNYFSQNISFIEETDKKRNVEIFPQMEHTYNWLGNSGEAVVFAHTSDSITLGNQNWGSVAFKDVEADSYVNEAKITKCEWSDMWSDGVKKPAVCGFNVFDGASIVFYYLKNTSDHSKSTLKIWGFDNFYGAGHSGIQTFNGTKTNNKMIENMADITEFDGETFMRAFTDLMELNTPLNIKCVRNKDDVYLFVNGTLIPFSSSASGIGVYSKYTSEKGNALSLKKIFPWLYDTTVAGNFGYFYQNTKASNNAYTAMLVCQEYGYSLGNQAISEALGKECITPFANSDFTFDKEVYFEGDTGQFSLDVAAGKELSSLLYNGKEAIQLVSRNGNKYEGSFIVEEAVEFKAVIKDKSTGTSDIIGKIVSENKLSKEDLTIYSDDIVNSSITEQDGKLFYIFVVKNGSVLKVKFSILNFCDFTVSYGYIHLDKKVSDIVVSDHKIEMAEENNIVEYGQNGEMVLICEDFKASLTPKDGWGVFKLDSAYSEYWSVGTTVLRSEPFTWDNTDWEYTFGFSISDDGALVVYKRGDLAEIRAICRISKSEWINYDITTGNKERLAEKFRRFIKADNATAATPFTTPLSLNLVRKANTFYFYIDEELFAITDVNVFVNGLADDYTPLSGNIVEKNSPFGLFTRTKTVFKNTSFFLGKSAVESILKNYKYSIETEIIGGNISAKVSCDAEITEKDGKTIYAAIDSGSSFILIFHEVEGKILDTFSVNGISYKNKIIEGKCTIFVKQNMQIEISYVDSTQKIFSITFDETEFEGNVAASSVNAEISIRYWYDIQKKQLTIFYPINCTSIEIRLDTEYYASVILSEEDDEAVFSQRKLKGSYTAEFEYGQSGIIVKNTSNNEMISVVGVERSENWYISVDLKSVKGNNDSVWALFGVSYANLGNKPRALLFNYNTSANAFSANNSYCGRYQTADATKGTFVDTVIDNIYIQKSVYNSKFTNYNTVLEGIRIGDEAYFIINNIIVAKFSMSEKYEVSDAEEFGLYLRNSTLIINSINYGIGKEAAENRLNTIGDRLTATQSANIQYGKDGIKISNSSADTILLAGGEQSDKYFAAEYDVSEAYGNNNSVWTMFGITFFCTSLKEIPYGITVNYNASKTTYDATNSYAKRYQIINGVSGKEFLDAAISDSETAEALFDARKGSGKSVNIKAVRNDDACYVYVNNKLFLSLSLYEQYGKRGNGYFGLYVRNSGLSICNYHFVQGENKILDFLENI